MKVALVRGGYLNKFEGESYAELPKSISLTAISSARPLHSTFSFPIIKLASFYDLRLPSWIANRIMGDRQNLVGLSSIISRYDIVHTADPHYYYTFQLAQLRKEGKIKCLISTSWETIPFNNESVRAKKRIKRFSLKHIDHFICYCQRAKNCLIQEGVNPKKISVVNLGVNLYRFHPKNNKNKNKKTLNVLFTGRDVLEKGLVDLRAALFQLIQDKKVKLLIASQISYEQMPRAYQLADIFVMPSKTTQTWEEQYGMSLVEAMASGLPIIAYRSGSIPELLGDAGILVKEGSITSLKLALEKLVKNPTLRSKLGTMARRRAELFFDSKKTAQKLHRIYETQYRNTHP